MNLELIFALAVVCVSGTVAGFAGFGFALVTVPALLLVYDPAVVITVNTALSLFTTTNVALGARRDVDVGTVARLLPFSFIGLVAGVEILKLAEPEYIRLAVGPLVVVSAILLFRGVRLPGADSRWADVVAGSTSGLLGTSTGIGGPPVVLLMASRKIRKHVFRATAAAYFIFTGVVGLALLFLRGVAGMQDLALAAILVPAVFAGKIAGTHLLSRSSEDMFRAVTLGIVALTGLLGAATAGFALF